MRTPDPDDIAGMPRDADGPVFGAPWQAQAFALTLSLHERGAFTWKEWAATLGEVITEVIAATPTPANGTRRCSAMHSACARRFFGQASSSSTR